MKLEGGFGRRTQKDDKKAKTSLIPRQAPGRITRRIVRRITGSIKQSTIRGRTGRRMIRTTTEK